MSRRRQTGFTLLEVLITLIVVGVGLLTVAGLQAMTRRVHFEAVQRTTATGLAQDLAERIRANSGAIASYATTDVTALSAPAACDPCTPAQQAAQDLYDWQQRLLGARELDSDGKAVGGLLSPTGCVKTSTSGTLTLVRIAIAWRGVSPRTDDSSTDDNLEYDDCGKAAMDGSSKRYDSPQSSSQDTDMRRYLVLDLLTAP